MPIPLAAALKGSASQPARDEVAEACRRLCKADHGAIWLLKDGLLHLGAHDGERAGAVVYEVRR